MINKRQQGGLIPQLQQENLNQAFCHVAHNVDLTSNSIRPAQDVTLIENIPNAEAISFQRNRLIWGDNIDDVFATTASSNFRITNNNTVYVDRDALPVSNPFDYFLEIPKIDNFSVSASSGTDVCYTDYTAYRIRYISRHGEISGVLAVSHLRQSTGTLSWDILTSQPDGEWVIERVIVPYQQLGKHTTKEYKDNFFVVGVIPVQENTFYDYTPISEVCDALPSFIDGLGIDDIRPNIGASTEQGELIIGRRGETELYVSYPNKPHLFPIYNIIETGNPVVAIVSSPKGAIIFHEDGTGVLSLETHSGEDTPTSHYTYFRTSNNISVSNPETISVRNNIVYFMSDLGLVMYPLAITITPQPKVVTFDVMADEVSKLSSYTMVGQAYEDGYYLTDGNKTFLITSLDAFYMTDSQVVIRTTSINSKIVTCDNHGFLLFKEGNGIYKTKFRYKIIDPKTSPIHVKIFGIDDRGEILIYERDLLHSDTFTIDNSFMYKKYSMELRFGGTDRASHDCIYRTKISLTRGLKSFGRGKVVRDVTEDTLRITEIGLMSRVHQFLSLKPT